MNKIKTFLKSLFYIFLYFIITIFVYSFFVKDMNSSNLVIANLSSILSDAIILFIFIIMFRKKLIPDFNDFKKNYKNIIKNNFKYWAIGLLLMIISNGIIGMVVGNLPANEAANREILAKLPISSIFSMVIVAPIIEELITRKTFKDVFNNEYVYIIFSGLTFGLLHLLVVTSLIETLYVIPYALLGCAFAKMYYKTDNLFAPIFYHSLHNLVAILIIFIGV